MNFKEKTIWNNQWYTWIIFQKYVSVSHGLYKINVVVGIQKWGLGQEIIFKAYHKEVRNHEDILRSKLLFWLSMHNTASILKIGH